jgi:glucose-6-phosphate 1-epimerase
MTRSPTFWVRGFAGLDLSLSWLLRLLACGGTSVGTPFRRMNLPPSICLLEYAPSYPVFEIEHPACAARVALHGAHVMSWRPRDEEEVLYLSPDAVFKEGKAIRGGIPICWPWFNAHPTNPGLPSHGIARGRFWEVVEAREDEDGVTIRFEMRDGIWNAVVTVRLGAELEIRLDSPNPNNIPIAVSGALHTYLSVLDIGQVRVMNLEDTEYLDTVGEPQLLRQQGALEFHGEVDSSYDSSTSALLVDDGMGRTILIEKSGSPSTVVWNPWEEKARAMADLPHDGYLKFCCIEAAIANDRAITIEPGGSHLLSTRISLGR